MMKPYLSIVLPAHNEEHRLEYCLDRLTEWIWNYTHYLTEIIIVSNGSTDRTMDVAYSWSQRWDMIQKPWTIPERSKAAAIKMGVMEARGELIMMMDVDLSMDPEGIRDFIQGAERGFDLVIGCRTLPGSRVMQSWRRRLSSRIFSLMTGLVVPEIQDTQCGFKLFTRLAALDLFANLKTRSLAFDVDLLLTAQQHGFHICQLPVTWIEDPDSRVRMVRDAAIMARDIFHLWERRRRWNTTRTMVVRGASSARNA